MNLANILEGLKFKAYSDISNIEVSGLACNSRAVKDGFLFVAFRGYAEDGYKYINDAIAKGARVVVSEKDFEARGAVTKVIVKDTRTSLPLMASNFYGRPGKSLNIIGVTGTNGKTTVTYIIENILKAGGSRAGVIGTISYRMGGKVTPAKNTTPGPIELESIFKEMAAGGLKHAVMEVSSHSLDQHRVDGISFDAAIFTNMTSEHLDYHKTIEDYLKAKAKIFGMLKPDGFAIINNDDKKVTSLRPSIKRKIISYGIKEDALIMAKDIRLSLDGTSFTMTTPDGPIAINTKLIGLHNVSNILAAAGAAFSLNMSLETIKTGVEMTLTVPGRLEPVDTGMPYKVFVDYAHTEDALNKILSLVRGVAKNKIITVFGCGGNRDKSKRPLMGKAACRFSDRAIITSDNPRLEDPLAIIGDIENGVKWSFSNYDIVPDRREAIAKAIEIASKGDIVIIAGKGHEDYQIIGDKIFPFDDRKVVMEHCRSRDNDAYKTDSKSNGREALIR